HKAPDVQQRPHAAAGVDRGEALRRGWSGVADGVQGVAADGEGVVSDGAVGQTGAGVARLQRRGGVDTAEQRVEVDVAVRRDQRVGDGVTSANGAGDRGVDVVVPVAEVEGVIT